VAVVALSLAALAPQAGAQTCTSPPAGLVAWWPADGNADDIAGGNDGVAQNGAGFAAGHVADAFSFDGIDDRIEVPDSPLWTFGGGDFTLDLWANFATACAEPGCIFIGNDEGGGSVNKWFFYATGDGYLSLHINSPSSSGPNIGHGVASFEPTPGTWYHVAITRAGSVYTFYVDGAAVGSVSSSEVIPDAAAPLTIGRAETLPSFNGLIDEVEVFHRALAASEILAIVAAGSAGKCKDADGDGVPDAQDDCPQSILTPTVVIDGCDSGVANTTFPTGCTISDRVQECADGAQNHGSFVSCVADLTNELKTAGVITGQQKGAIQSCAAQADIP
jgi:hypothetical protein